MSVSRPNASALASLARLACAALLAVAVSLVGMTASPAPAEEAASVVVFGSYCENHPYDDALPIEWYVLDLRDDGSALLLSKHLLDDMWYFDDYGIAAATWETSIARSWLNSEFLETAFTDDERTHIRLTHIDNYYDPPEWPNVEGGADTDDYVFLLSVGEVEHYFGVEPSSLWDYPDVGVEVEPRPYLSATWAEDGGVGSWWLRTPASRQDFASFVNTNGWMWAGTDGQQNGTRFAMRPAIWVDAGVIGGIDEIVTVPEALGVSADDGQTSETGNATPAEQVAPTEAAPAPDAGTPAPQPAPQLTPVFETTVDGHTYAVYCDSLTWHEAKAFCESQGGHLVTITDFFEQQIVAGLTDVGAEKGAKANYWIGLTTETGTPTWVTGEPYEYSNWRDGQPDGYVESDGRVERYAHIFADDWTGTDVFYHTWNDACDEGSNDMWYFALDRFGFICEFDDVANSPQGPVPSQSPQDAGIVDMNGTNLLVGYAWERTKAICDYTVSENIAAMGEEDGGASFGHAIYESLGLAELSQIYAFSHWGDMMAAVFTVPDDSPAFLTAFTDSWQRPDGSNCYADVKSLFDAIQARAGLSHPYESPVGWTDDVVMVLANYESGYAFVTDFHAIDQTSIEGYTVVCYLGDGGDWAPLVVDLLYNGALAGSPFPAFTGQTYGDQYVGPLPDNGVPSGADSAPSGTLLQNPPAGPASEGQASVATASISGYDDAVWGADERLQVLGKWPFADRLVTLFDSLQGWNVEGALDVFPGAVTIDNLLAHRVMQNNWGLHDEVTSHGPLLRSMAWNVVEIVPMTPERLQQREGGDLYWFDDGYLIYVDCAEASEGEWVHSLYGVYALKWGDQWWLVFEN